MKAAVAFAIFIMLLAAGTHAESLKVEKSIQNKDVNVGDDVTILLKFTNPFQGDLPVKIADKNVFGNNGIDVQCLEYNLPPGEATIAYEPIKPFAPGQYTLEAAKVTYTNPGTGTEESAKSNPLEISVKGNAQHGQAQGITNIYRCGGVNIQSSSYSSSGSSFNVQIGASSSGQAQSSQGSVQNNQLNQDTGALKQQMEKQTQQQKQMEDEFKNSIAESREFQQNNQKMEDLGYNLSGSTFSPVSGNTGSFNLSYQKPGGETAELRGEIANGTMKNIMSLTDEDKKEIVKALQNNSQFIEYDRQLTGKGFNSSGPEFSQISQNHTIVSVPYKNLAGGESRIIAEYVNNTIKSVSLVPADDNQDNMMLLLLILAAVALAGFAAYRKFFMKKKAETPQNVVKEKAVDYSKEARDLLDESRQLFDKGREKDAYEKVSQAIRLYFSYKLNLKANVTNMELLRTLKKENHRNYEEVKKCLGMCSMVEFAKHKPGKKDFINIFDTVENILE